MQTIAPWQQQQLTPCVRLCSGYYPRKGHFNKSRKWQRAHCGLQHQVLFMSAINRIKSNQIFFKTARYLVLKILSTVNSRRSILPFPQIVDSVIIGFPFSDVHKYAGIPREERICLTCDRRGIGDEFHYLFNCTYTVLKDSRKFFFLNISASPEMS